MENLVKPLKEFVTFLSRLSWQATVSAKKGRQFMRNACSGSVKITAGSGKSWNILLVVPTTIIVLGTIALFLMIRSKKISETSIKSSTVPIELLQPYFQLCLLMRWKANCFHFFKKLKISSSRKSNTSYISRRKILVQIMKSFKIFFRNIKIFRKVEIFKKV